MNSTLILYKSKYGATEKYARMLQKELSCDIRQNSRITPTDLAPYTTIILMGGIYAGGIAGLSTFKKNQEALSSKKTAIFCVGASPLDASALDQIRQVNLKGSLQEIPLFYGRGAWDESVMTFKDRMLCKLLQKAVAKKEPADMEPWMKELFSAIGKKCDWTDKSYLKPLLTCHIFQ